MYERRSPKPDTRERRRLRRTGYSLLADTRTAFEDTENKLSVSWVSNDAIGISVEVAGQTTSSNIKYLANGGGFNTTFDAEDPANSIAKWEDAQQAHDFYAYYPYSAGSTNPAALPSRFLLFRHRPKPAT